MLSIQERADLKKRIVNASLYYGKQINLDVAEMYLNALDGYSYEQITRAINEYAKNSKNRFMFLAADLIQIIDPQPTEENIAREISARISQAVTKFGWPNSTEARQYLGEVAWSIVEKRGGWAYICENLGLTIDPTTFDAQNRELAKTAVIKHNNPEFSNLLESAVKGMPKIDGGKIDSIEDRRTKLLEQAEKLKGE